MTATYDLYGLIVASLEEAKTLIEKALGISLAAHESGYHCGAYYRSGDVGAEHFILQRNRDATEGEWAESDHSDAPFLLYVNETQRAAELRELLDGAANVRLLRTEEA